MEKHSEGTATVAITADGQTIASGSFDKTIKVWNLVNGEEMYTLTGDSGYALSVAISADGRLTA